MDKMDAAANGQGAGIRDAFPCISCNRAHALNDLNDELLCLSCFLAEGEPTSSDPALTAQDGIYVESEGRSDVDGANNNTDINSHAIFHALYALANSHIRAAADAVEVERAISLLLLVMWLELEFDSSRFGPENLAVTGHWVQIHSFQDPLSPITEQTVEIVQ
ncbi:hypothetical protein DFH06DRAFT_1301387 [Mycena polygramma]|nr:hypothetical protein DFH06DRAFT_1301387 [Mycena polygramma]